MKALNSKHQFRVPIRDREHFFRIINWMNSNVGKGREFWSIEGKVMKHLDRNKTVVKTIYVYVDDFDETISTYLNLL